MKKTLLAVAIPALLASGAASATTLYDNNGTKIDIRGSLRLALEYQSDRDASGEDGTKFRDLGSRFGFKVLHDIGDGLYGIGELEMGHNTQQQERSFQLRNRQAYVGLGLEDVGEMTFGRVLAPTDDVDLTDIGYDYTRNWDYGHGVGRGDSDNFIGRVSNTVKFMSADFNGFSFGATYSIQGDDSWGSDNDFGRRAGEIRNAYTAAAFYDTGFGLKVNAGYGHAKMNGGPDSLTTPTENNKFETDIYGLSAEYTIDALSVSGTVGRVTAKDTTTDIATGTKTTQKPKAWLYGVAAKYNIDKANVYGAYYYSDGNDQAEFKNEHIIVVGSDYHLSPSVRTYVEYAHTREKAHEGNKENDNKAMVGLRVYF